MPSIDGFPEAKAEPQHLDIERAGFQKCYVVFLSIPATKAL
jgi:hypothetical protein